MVQKNSNYYALKKNLQFVRGGDAGPGLGHLGVEGGGPLLELGQLLAALGLLDVVLGDAIVLQASEGDLLLQKLGVAGLAPGGALGDLLLGQADLVGPPEDGVLQDGAGAVLGLQRLGNLERLKRSCRILAGYCEDPCFWG